MTSSMFIGGICVWMGIKIPQRRTSLMDCPSLARTAAANLPKAMLHVVRKVLLGEVGSPRSGKSAGSDMPESAGLISWMSSTRPDGSELQVVTFLQILFQNVFAHS